MRGIGLLLITVGFLAGAYFATQSADNVIPWGTFGPAVVVCALGVALARMALRKEKSDAGNLKADIADLRTSIASIVLCRKCGSQSDSGRPSHLSPSWATIASATGIR